jgi:prepilin-type processing-associated H-X9-DG protein
VVLVILGVLSFAAFVFLMLPAPARNNEAARQTTCRNNLKQIALAMCNYQQSYGCFPPAFIPDKNGKPMHSWRVLILPYLEAEDLYRQYRFDEPWDGPHNRLLADKMPKVYCCPSARSEGPVTDYAMIIGAHAVSNGPKSCTLKDIKDGASSTTLVVEASDAGINWMEPRDLDAEKMTFRILSSDEATCEGKCEISSPHSGGANIGFSDGTARFVPSHTEPDKVKAMTTIDGGEKDCVVP